MRHHALALTALTLCAPLLACLTETRRGEPTDTSDTSDTSNPSDTTDTNDPRDADTSDTRPDGDTSELCQGVSCDDQDECTHDYCDPATGECVHLAYPEPPSGEPGAEPPSDPAMPPLECQNGCDDGNACTEDTCLWVPEGCGVQGYYTCVHTPLDGPGCGSCEAACDDGNPCTTDYCTGTSCRNLPIEGCDANCTAQGTQSIGDIIAQGPTRGVKTVGALFAHPLYKTCDDGPDCGCQGYPGLYDQTSQLLLDAPTDFDFDTWTCKSTGCGTATTVCTPAQLAVRYRVWGASIPDFQVGQPGATPRNDPPEGALPPAQVGAIAVTDFCLETTAASLTGDYAGAWIVDGVEARFKATIQSDTAVRLTVSDIVCPPNTWCPQANASFQTTVTVGDGYIDVAWSGLPNQLDAWPLRLYSRRNTLTGRYGPDATPFAGGAEAPRADVAFPVGGTFTLTRLAPTTTSWELDASAP